MHSCVTNIHPCFQDEDAEDETCFYRETRLLFFQFFQYIIVKVLLVSWFADYRANIGGLMW